MENEEKQAELVVEELVTDTQTKTKGFIGIVLGLKQFFIDFYQANFNSTEDCIDESDKHKKRIDHSVVGLQKDYRRRMGRSVNAITNRAVSSTKGNPTRQKKVVVTSKTYKPELDRF